MSTSDPLASIPTRSIAACPSSTRESMTVSPGSMPSTLSATSCCRSPRSTTSSFLNVNFIALSSGMDRVWERWGRPLLREEMVDSGVQPIDAHGLAEDHGASRLGPRQRRIVVEPRGYEDLDAGRLEPEAIGELGAVHLRHEEIDHREGVVVVGEQRQRLRGAHRAI